LRTRAALEQAARDQYPIGALSFDHDNPAEAIATGRDTGNPCALGE
jgi:hypothetical protein